MLSYLQGIAPNELNECQKFRKFVDSAQWACSKLHGQRRPDFCHRESARKDGVMGCNSDKITQSIINLIAVPN